MRGALGTKDVCFLLFIVFSFVTLSLSGFVIEIP